MLMTLAQIQNIPATTTNAWIWGFAGAAVLVGSIFWSWNQGTRALDRYNGKNRDPEPPNSTLGQNLLHLDRRVTNNEQGISSLRDEVKKTREDNERHASIRSKTIFDHIERVRHELNSHTEAVRVELSDKLDDMPDRVITTLKNTGAI